MLCLSGFELYSRWVPLLYYYLSVRLSRVLFIPGDRILLYFRTVRRDACYLNWELVHFMLLPRTVEQPSSKYSGNNITQYFEEKT